MTRAEPIEARGYFAPLSSSKYMLLTTFRRDGRAVGTPVHVVARGDVAFFRTWDPAGKAKRLRHTSLVEIASSNVRGRPRGPSFPAQAVLLHGEASDQAALMLATKHPLLHRRLIPWYHRRRGWATQQYRLVPPPGTFAPFADHEGPVGRS